MRNASTQNRPCRRQRLGAGVVGTGGLAGCHRYQSRPGRDQGGRAGGWHRGKGKKETKKRLCVFVYSLYWFINDKLMT